MEKKAEHKMDDDAFWQQIKPNWDANNIKKFQQPTIQVAFPPLASLQRAAACCQRHTNDTQFLALPINAFIIPFH